MAAHSLASAHPSLPPRLPRPHPASSPPTCSCRLRTITDVSQAIDWLRSTFFYVRARTDPARYGLPPELAHATTDALDRWLRDKLILGTIRQLAQHGLVGCHAGIWTWGVGQ